MIDITLPDGTIKQVDKNSTAMDLALSISDGLARNVLAAEVNGAVVDATLPITQSASLKLLTWRDDEGKSTMWHSSAHLMAEAIQFYYPEAKFAIGPPISKGFYYDIDFMGASFSEKDLPKIESKIKELAKAKNEYLRKEISKEEAVAYFNTKADPYKLELLEGLEDGGITFYTQGAFTDLCRGPHIPHTGFIKAVKLTAVAGAYWRGDEKNKQLTRIYGITFPKQGELSEHLETVSYTHLTLPTKA